jgi:hypothetical protein
VKQGIIVLETANVTSALLANSEELRNLGKIHNVKVSARLVSTALLDP